MPGPIRLLYQSGWSPATEVGPGWSDRPTGFGMTAEVGKRSGPPLGRSLSGVVRTDLRMSKMKDRSLMASFVCRLCFERDGIVSKNVVAHDCTNNRTGKVFTAFVCVRCLEAARETRVTCRTFTPVTEHGAVRFRTG